VRLAGGADCCGRERRYDCTTLFARAGTDTAANAQSIALAARERPAFATLLSQALRQPLAEERFARLR